MMDIELFKAKRKNSERSENFNMFIVILIVVSVIVFSMQDAAITKNLIWYWAGFMGTLLSIAVILDIITWRKNKNLEKNWRKR